MTLRYRDEMIGHGGWHLNEIGQIGRMDGPRRFNPALAEG